MRRLGLIGGMSWESSLAYYRLINEAIRDRFPEQGGLKSADLILHSLDFTKIVALQRANRWDEAAQILVDSAKGLESAGAEAVMICTNTMHLVADQVAEAITVPLINIIDVTAKTLKQQGLSRPLLLATRYTLTHGFYADRMARHDIKLTLPDSNGTDACQSIIFEQLCAGIICPQARQCLIDMIKSEMPDIDCVILGCTELSLSLTSDIFNDLGIPGLCTARIHAQSAVDFCLEPELAPLEPIISAEFA